MTTYGVSKWFTIEADDYEEAQRVADKIGTLVENSDEIFCTDSGDIDVEEHEE